MGFILLERVQQCLLVNYQQQSTVAWEAAVDSDSMGSSSRQWHGKQQLTVSWEAAVDSVMAVDSVKIFLVANTV